ncbi:MAG: peptidylprolyl isomerase [Gammaproteobacteria bacterium]|nr:peptidylprolyl isomerase [Gammaproteobacteria bacterium]MCY4210404.1 peptidylprolyl isomerase [Gammaproteobacteria bacterium]MCY4282800.1 peptidylprolyl isomerase [Gammaproteobacteria bacterium]MCY4339369.1 peptidylprolyl isomerase [Gammaproteobacteria bacterium]
MNRLLLLAVILLSGPVTAVQDLDRIVAVINDDVIMRSELLEKIRSVSAQMEEQNIPLPPQDILEKQVLDRLIMTRLQIQMAGNTGIRVDDETLNRTISNIARENQLSLNEFREILEGDGYGYENFRKEIRNEILISRLQQRQVDNRVIVTEREIENYLSNQEHQGETDIEFRISHILIAIPEGASTRQVTQARETAEKVLSELQEGADFSSMAATYSDGQQALDGGDLGWRKAGQVPTLFADFIAAMEVGGLSEIIKSPSGYHIIRLQDKRSSEQVVVTQTKARHILVRPDELTTPEDALRRLQQLRMRIAGGDDFAELARAHSADTMSAAEGGDLGWVNPGDLVPEFENVMDTLEPGATSEPFRSQFGFHIVQVLDRREHDSTEDIKRARAREAIRRRKLEEARTDWLRQMRDEAYVEYRLES